MEMRAVQPKVKQTTRSSIGVVLPRVRRRLLSSLVGVDMTTDMDDVIRCPNMSSGRVGWSMLDQVDVAGRVCGLGDRK